MAMINKSSKSGVFGFVDWAKWARHFEASRFTPRDPSKVRQDFNAPLNTTVHTLTKILAIPPQIYPIPHDITYPSRNHGSNKSR